MRTRNCRSNRFLKTGGISLTEKTKKNNFCNFKETSSKLHGSTQISVRSVACIAVKTYFRQIKKNAVVLWCSFSFKTPKTILVLFFEKQMKKQNVSQFLNSMIED